MGLLNGILHLIVIILLVISMVVAEENKQSNCEKPVQFQNMQVMRQYIDCVKSDLSRYGKRSQTNLNPAMMNFPPSVSQFLYGSPRQRDQQDLFELLKQYNN